MLRKKGKMPNAVAGQAYTKEYAGTDALCIPRGAVAAGDRVLVIDDLAGGPRGNSVLGDAVAPANALGAHREPSR